MPKGYKTKRIHAIDAALQRDRELNAAAVVEQIRRGALYDVRRLFLEGGKIKPIQQLDEQDAAMIEGFEVVRRNLTSGDGQTDEVLKYKLAPRSAYLRMAGEYHGLFTQKVELSGSVDIEDRLTKGRERARRR